VAAAAAAAERAYVIRKYDYIVDTTNVGLDEMLLVCL